MCDLKLKSRENACIFMCEIGYNAHIEIKGKVLRKNKDIK